MEIRSFFTVRMMLERNPDMHARILTDVTKV